MKEKELKYMGNTIKYKETEIPNRVDNFGRPLVIKVAKQSDAEQITDEDSGVMYWSGGTFFDMQINTYIKDEDYNIITDDDMIELAKKIKL